MGARRTPRDTRRANPSWEERSSRRQPARESVRTGEQDLRIAFPHPLLSRLRPTRCATMTTTNPTSMTNDATDVMAWSELNISRYAA